MHGANAGLRRSGHVLNWYSSQFKNNHFTEMCCGTEVGSYARLIDSCITQLKAQGPSRTCNESKEEGLDLSTMEAARGTCGAAPPTHRPARG